MSIKGTFIGFIAILLWALLALFSAQLDNIPPFQILFLTFAIGALVGFIKMAKSGRAGFSALRAPRSAWALSIAGLFLYHFFYFTALKNAPVVEVSLIAYLWPLLIVFFSALLPGNRLHIAHVVGALLGLAGAASIILGKGNGAFHFEMDHAFGLIMAGLCALTWSIYSVVNRRFQNVPSETVAGFCLGVTLLGLLSHLTLESWVQPNLNQWLAIAGLGLGPLGLAFYSWDYGTKHGNLPLLGVLSYSAPLLSTLVLIVAGQAELTQTIIVACLFITIGAFIASCGPKLLGSSKKPKTKPA